MSEKDERDGLVHYPFPLRPGLMVFLYLPPDLTKADVARIRDLLYALVTEPPPS